MKAEASHIWMAMETGECMNSQDSEDEGRGEVFPLWLGAVNAKHSHIARSIQTDIHPQILVLFTPNHTSWWALLDHYTFRLTD